MDKKHTTIIPFELEGYQIARPKKKMNKEEIRNKFGLDIDNLPVGLRLPNDIYPYLDEERKKVWNLGWRGNVHSFCDGPSSSCPYCLKEYTYEQWQEKQSAEGVNKMSKSY